jgi:hypothetical protein
MRITKSKSETVIEGKLIRLRVLELKDGNSCMEIDARGQRGWVPVLASERSTVSVHERTQALGPVMKTRNRLIEFSQKLVSAEVKGGAAEIVLTGKSGGSEAAQQLTFGDADSHVNVRTTVKLGGPARVAALGTAYLFVPDGMLFAQYEPLDFCWIPHLRREPDGVIGDQIFRSPAVIYQTGKIMAALVPDLDVLAGHRAMPAALDAQLENAAAGAPAFWYGFCNYKNDGHLFFRQSPPVKETIKGELVYACDLLVSARTPERHAHRDVAAHLWRRYGSKLIGNEAPQTLPYEDYARRAYGYAFERGGIWREFEIGGEAVGGTIVQTFAGPVSPGVMKKAEIEGLLKMQKVIPRLHGIATEKILSTTVMNDIVERYMHYAPKTIPPLIMNIAWFNNMRTAYGAYAYGELLNDDNVKSRAVKMKELALRAPGEAGLMRSCCYVPDEGGPIWVQGTKAFEAVREYHLPDSAWTGWWMLRWYEELEKDARLLDRAKEFGGAFRALQQESGAIPGWARVRSGGLIPHAKMIESAQTAAPGMFLARLGRVAGHMPSLAAAERAARFMIEKVFPENKWWDFETFFSCSKKDFGMRDTGTGLHCMNNLCMYWTAEMMRELYEATGKAAYLEHGLRALDLMLMWQQVWNVPYISINTFGGFGVMNTDGEWNDARQSMFAESLMAYYELTGEREYFERGVAALRASFTTMLTPGNRAVAPGNMGMYIEKDEGATYENFAHLGYDRRAPGYIMFDWGSGGACSAAARMTRRYGEIYIDAARGHAFGLDLCTVTELTIGAGKVSFDIAAGSKKRTFYTKIVGLSSGRYRLSANGVGQGTHTAEGLNGGVVVTL